MPLEGLQLGHYRLLRLIGSGGMGEVYLAEDARLDRQVAIKVIRAEAGSYPNALANKEAARLFQREAKAIALLDHPHILPLFDFGEEDMDGAELTYLVMPFRPEGSLANWLRQRSDTNLLSIGDVEHFVQQAASALQYAHKRQIIHQDVKPPNFLIRSNSAHANRPDLLLTDFGVAKLSSATSSMSHSVRGTPTYMAPEQWSGDAVPATDQYALAVMAYELLTGRPPFQGPPMRMMYLHTQVQAQPPSTLNPQIPTDMDTVLLCALAKQPSARFASMAAFANAFSQSLQSIDPPTIINILYKLASTEAITPSNPGSIDKTIPASNPNIASHTLQAPDVTQAQKPTKRQGTSKGKIILLLGLVLLLVLSSVGFLLYTNVKNQESFNNATTATAQSLNSAATAQANNATAQVNANATAQANAVATARANTLATAQANAQATAQAQTNANATAQAQANVNANATATATTRNGNPDPYPPYNGTLGLDDPLSDNNQGNHWSENQDSLSACTFVGGAYHVIENKNMFFSDCFSDPYFSNFAYQVQMQIIQGDCGGVMFRVNPTHTMFYYFRICQDGSYALFLYVDNKNADAQTLTSGNSSAIRTGLSQTNLIAAVANGSQISLYVNQQPIASVTDSSYSNGHIGVVAQDEGNPTEVVFSSMKVWVF